MAPKAMIAYPRQHFSPGVFMVGVVVLLLVTPLLLKQVSSPHTPKKHVKEAVDVVFRPKPLQIVGVNKDVRRDSCPHGTSAEDPAHKRTPERFIEAKHAFVQIPAVQKSLQEPNGPQQIPRVLFSCGRSQGLPTGMFESFDSWNQLNPEYTVRFFDDPAMSKFISRMSAKRLGFELPRIYKKESKRYIEVDLASIYESLALPQMRESLFKYVYLYVHGGVYIATDIVTITHLDTMIRVNDTIVVAAGDTRTDSATVSEKFIAVSPKQGFLRSLIISIVQKVSKRTIPTRPDQITGNGAITAALQQHLGRKIQTGRDNTTVVYRRVQKKICDYAVVLNKDTPLFVDGYVGEQVELEWYQPDTVEDAWKSDTLYLKKALSSNASADDFTIVEEPELGPDDCPFGLTYDAQPEANVAEMVDESERHLLFMPKKTCRRKLGTKKLRIPRKILQTARDPSVPVGMYQAMQRVIHMNPDFEHFYFDDASARVYIKENMGESYVEAFDSLIPGAYKSDFFRYVWLYVEGGVYLDGDEYMVSTLNDFLTPQDEFVSAEDPGHLVHNAFIAVTPKHPIVTEVLHDVFDFVSRREYNTEVLDLTGPGALGRAMRKHLSTVLPPEVDTTPEANKQYTMTIRLVQHDKSRTEAKKCSISMVRSHEKILMYSRYPQYRSEMRWYLDQEPYWTMWRERRIYAAPLGASLSPPSSFDTHHKQLWASCPYHLTADEEKNSLGRASETPLKRIALQISPTATSNNNNVSNSLLSQAAVLKLETDVEIPRTIVQHFRESIVPIGMFKSMHNIHIMNPESEYRFFSADDAEKFIEENMNKSAVLAYKALLPGPMRSQFFRYCYLYAKGGIWIDPQYVNVFTVANLLKEGDSFIGTVLTQGDTKLLSPGFIAATASHPILEQLVNNVVAAIAARKVASDPITTTGAQALTEAFVTTMGENPEPNSFKEKLGGIRLLQEVKNADCAVGGVMWKNEYYFFTRYASYLKEMRWFETESEHAVDYWKGKNPYKASNLN